MPILELKNKLSGYLVVSVRGDNTEKFINLCIKNGLVLWDIRQAGKEARLKVQIEDFFEMRPLAKKTGCRLRIVKKAGVPFLAHRLAKRRGFALGAVFFIVSLYFMSSFVWFISVRGNETIREERILELAEQLGIKPGVPKSKLDTERLANEMILLEDEISWVNFTLQGTRLLIEVAEKTKPPRGKDRPVNLVAAKDGLVEDVLVVMGEPRVKPGDTVSRGDLLIEGVLLPQSPYREPGKEEPEPKQVHARGEVWARVWYEAYGEALLAVQEKHKTGKRVSTWTLLYGGEEVLRLGKKDIPFRNYSLETVRRSLPKRIINIPVELVTQHAFELSVETVEIPREKALDIAAERARMLAEVQLPVGVSVVDVFVEEVALQDDNLVGVRYVIETYENIAMEDVTGGD